MLLIDFNYTNDWNATDIYHKDHHAGSSVQENNVVAVFVQKASYQLVDRQSTNKSENKAIPHKLVQTEGIEINKGAGRGHEIDD